MNTTEYYCILIIGDRIKPLFVQIYPTVGGTDDVNILITLVSSKVFISKSIICKDVINFLLLKGYPYSLIVH